MDPDTILMHSIGQAVSYTHLLLLGDYILTETKAPAGHAITQQAFQVTINKDITTERVVVNKLRPTGLSLIHI